MFSVGTNYKVMIKPGQIINNMKGLIVFHKFCPNTVVLTPTELRQCLLFIVITQQHV